MQISIKNAFAALSNEKEKHFSKVMEHGTMSVEIYRPVKIDLQKPHEQDELYIVISGSGDFINKGNRIKFNNGDVLFVPAGIDHHFENFTDDFATWVIFYGAQGGENKL